MANRYSIIAQNWAGPPGGNTIVPVDDTHPLPVTSTAADGADATEGATTDAAVTTDTNGTLSGKLRGLVKILGSVWDSVNGLLNINLSRVGGNAIANGGANGGQGIGGLVAAGAAVSGCNPVPIAWQDQSSNAYIPQANLDATALVSAARTATTDSPDITINGHRGIVIFLNVSAASGTGGLQVVYRGKDSISGNYVNFANLPTAITATGTTAYVFYPGASSAAGNIKAATQDPIAHVGNIHVAHGDSTSYTYSVSYSLIL